MKNFPKLERRKEGDRRGGEGAGGEKGRKGGYKKYHCNIDCTE
jgi:hypothetical protein